MRKYNSNSRYCSLDRGDAALLLFFWVAVVIPMITFAEGASTLVQGDPSTVTAASQAGLFELPEKEVTLFDIYLGDKFQGLILVEYDGKTFHVPDPDDLVEQLKGVTAVSEVVPLVSGEGPAERVIPGVGTVRFDGNTFRVLLQLESQILFGSSLDLTGRIPAPEAKGSLRQDLRFAVSDGTGESATSSSAFTHRTLAGFGKSYLDYDATVLDDSTYELNRGSATSFVYDLQITGGYLRSSGQRFAGNTDYFGLSVQTAEEILVNEETLRGSRLDVFVPSRSRVEFFRGGRLLSAQILDFGLQEVDTSLFPQGSYNVEIVITEASGAVTRENRFYTKSGLLAVRDRPVLRFSAGQQRNDFDVFDPWYGEAGVRWRALDFLDLEGAFATTEDVGIGTVNINALLGDFIFEIGGAYSTDSQRGIDASVSGTILGFGFTTSYSKTLDPVADQSQFSNGAEGEDGEPFDPLVLQTTTFNQLAVRRRDLSAQVSRQVGPFTLQYRAQQNLFADEEERKVYGPGLEWRVWNSGDGKNEVRLNVQHLKTESGDNTTGYLTYRRSFAPWKFDVQLTEQRTDGDSVHRLRTDVTYDQRTRGGYGTRARLGIEGISDDDESTVSSADLESNLRYLKVGGFVRDQRFGLEDSTAYGGNLDTSLFLTQEGSLSVSRPPEQDALLVASITSASSDAVLSLIVNGQTIERLKPGGRVVVGLQPFRSYEIYIRQEDREEIVQYQTEPYRITVFPGNVVERTWNVERVFIGIGKIVDEGGQSIPRTRLRGLPGYVVTEDDGTFQAEIIGNESFTLNTESGVCEVKFAELEQSPQYFHDYGVLTCRRISE
jgi:hypothetical protein